MSTPTIAESITALTQAKADIIAALEAKGATVPESAKLADIATLIGRFEPISSDYTTYVSHLENGASADSVVIPEGVTKIGKNVFYDCTSLDTLSLPQSLTAIDDGAFYNCRSLGMLNVPGGVISISQDAFYGCKNLKQITFNEGLQSIGTRAFYNCSALGYVNATTEYELVLPEGLVQVRDEAFYNCTRLRTIRIPSTILYLRENCFYGMGSSTATSQMSKVIWFESKPKEEIEAMENYPWGLPDGTLIYAANDETLTVRTSS